MQSQADWCCSNDHKRKQQSYSTVSRTEKAVVCTMLTVLPIALGTGEPVLTIAHSWRWCNVIIHFCAEANRFRLHLVRMVHRRVNHLARVIDGQAEYGAHSWARYQLKVMNQYSKCNSFWFEWKFSPGNCQFRACSHSKHIDSSKSNWNKQTRRVINECTREWMFDWHVNLTNWKQKCFALQSPSSSTVSRSNPINHNSVCFPCTHRSFCWLGLVCVVIVFNCYHIRSSPPHLDSIHGTANRMEHYESGNNWPLNSSAHAAIDAWWLDAHHEGFDCSPWWWFWWTFADHCRLTSQSCIVSCHENSNGRTNEWSAAWIMVWSGKYIHWARVIQVNLCQFPMLIHPPRVTHIRGTSRASNHFRWTIRLVG